MQDIETKTIKREVDVTLTEQERADLREKACAALDRVDEMAEASKALKLEAKEARKTAKKGSISRLTECIEERDFSQNEFRIIVPGTGQVVERRTLTADERQTMIDVGTPLAETTGRKKKLKAQPTEPDPDRDEDEGLHAH